MMKRQSSLMLFPQALVKLIDQGKILSITELDNIVDKDKLLDYFRELGSEESYFTEMQVEDLQEFCNHIGTLSRTYYGEHYRKFGIKNNGLCLILQFAIDFIFERKK